MELWTYEHFITIIPALIVMLIIAFLLNKWLGKKDLKIRMIPFQVVSVILFLLEVGKQVVSFIKGYDLYHIPLHFCSLFIFAIPVMAFYKGKYRNLITSITSTLCVSLFLFMLIYPNLIYSAGNINGFFNDFFDFHTVAFHNLVLFEFILIVALNLHEPSKKKYYKEVAVFGACYSLIAGVMAQVLKVNFSNFYSCNIGPIETIRNSLIESIGYLSAQAIYVFVLGILHILFVLFAYVLFLTVFKIKKSILKK